MSANLETALQALVDAKWQAAEAVRHEYRRGDISLDDVANFAANGIPVAIEGTSYVTVVVELQHANTGDLSITDLDVSLPMVRLADNASEYISVEAVGLVVTKIENGF
jgi:hypothetical protein